MSTNITEEMQKTFDAITSGEYSNLALFSCFVDGQPTAAIAAVVKHSEDDIRITPLVIFPTADMVLTDHDGNIA